MHLFDRFRPHLELLLQRGVLWSRSDLRSLRTARPGVRRREPQLRPESLPPHLTSCPSARLSGSKGWKSGTTASIRSWIPGRRSWDDGSIFTFRAATKRSGSAGRQARSRYYGSAGIPTPLAMGELWVGTTKSIERVNDDERPTHLVAQPHDRTTPAAGWRLPLDRRPALTWER